MNADLNDFVNMALKLLGKALTEGALLEAALVRAQEAAAQAASEIAGLKAHINILEDSPKSPPEVH